MIERKAYGTERRLHLLVVLGQHQHLSVLPLPLSLSPVPGDQTCLCPARRRQRTDSTVSAGGSHTDQAVVFVAVLFIYLVAFKATTHQIPTAHVYCSYQNSHW